MSVHHIFVVSDGTGETATRICKAAVLQFKSSDPVLTRHHNVRNAEKIREVVRDAERERALVIHTFASEHLRKEMDQVCRELKVMSQDLLGPLFEKLEEFLGIAPTEKPGILHQLDNEYFERIDALAFAVHHDDTRSLADVKEADIILVGVSRTSKTPVSIYLAQEGWKVANVPLVLEESLPAELSKVDPSRVVGLMTSAERLAEIRRARLQRLGSKDSTYADIGRVQEELAFAQDLFSRHPQWTCVDITAKSIEEIAAEILDKLFGRERHL